MVFLMLNINRLRPIINRILKKTDLIVQVDSNKQKSQLNDTTDIKFGNLF